MIRLFRKVSRLNMKSTKYVKYAVGEILADFSNDV